MRRPVLWRLLERLAAMMTAAALAEENEAEKARRMLSGNGPGERDPRSES
jgi:hypothetical protein